MGEKTNVDYIGNIVEGRKNLGPDMPVSVYRLFESTMKEALIEQYGKEGAKQTFRRAGQIAGKQFAEDMLNLNVDIHQFIAEVQRAMKTQKMGLFRLEKIDDEAKKMVIAISEDLDCSGMPISGETVCNYDEGFLRGVLKAYTGDEYEVEEVDCWAIGGRVCRFEARKL